MSTDKLLRTDESQNDETFKTYVMKHIVIFRHTSTSIRTEIMETIEHDYEWDDFGKALTQYQDKVIEYASHIGTLSATKLETSIKLVSKDDEGTTILHYKILMNN